ncbi:MAG: metallopeptidase family protein [Firmicutes bacterium]|nr:metallopeptidase family protein [Bacillota bacterium]
MSGKPPKRGGVPLTLREFRALAGRLVDRLPPVLARELSGGFQVAPGAMRDGDLYVLGEYVEDPVLGRLVVLYYGSFVAVYRGADREVWERELWETIRHELRHHLEALAGTEELAREEEAEMEARKARERRRADSGRARPGRWRLPWGRGRD